MLKPQIFVKGEALVQLYFHDYLLSLFAPLQVGTKASIRLVLKAQLRKRPRKRSNPLRDFHRMLIIY